MLSLFFKIFGRTLQYMGFYFSNQGWNPLQ